MVQQNTVLLTTILKTPFDLVYAIPLLLISLLLLFAGTFLTLDRTRSFAPKSDAAAKKFVFRPEGGIGGLAIGYVFGLHLTTLASVLIMNDTRSKPLTPVQFLVAWLVPTVPLALIGARWKLAALVFFGLCGSASITLFLSVVFHPRLLVRLILLCIITPILTVLCLIPKPNIRHTACRVASTFTGGFGITVAIALLAHISSWGNVWLRFVLQGADDWGSAKEKGLSAAMAILCLVGAAADWSLRRKFGEDPDEKWDSYLANYTSGLPANGDRAGAFEPLNSFWGRLFGNSGKTRPILFPSDADLSSTKRSPNLLRGRSKPRRKAHPLAGNKFRPINDPFASDSDGDDSDLERAKAARPEWLKKHLSSLSGSTLYGNSEPGEQDRLKKMKGQFGAGADYSDGETEDKLPPQKEGEPWKPAFLRRHESLRTASNKDGSGFQLVTYPSSPAPSNTLAPPPPLGAVPATPSLIQAMNRISAAQNVAFGQQPSDNFLLPPYHTPKGQKSPSEEWKGFWTEVRDRSI